MMNKMVNTAMTGLALGVAVGATSYMMNSRSMKGQRKKIKKTADKAMHTVGEFIDNVSYMMK